MSRALRAPALALFGATLLAVSFQPLNFGPVLGWISMLPLLLALEGRGRGAAFALGWLFGLGVNLSLCAVLLPIPNLHLFQILLICAYVACYPALWSAAIAGGNTRSPGFPWFAAALWTVLEYVKANAGFLAFPVGNIAQTQVDNLWLLQIASVFGEGAISFLVVLGNLLLWQLWRRAPRQQILWGALTIGLAVAFGAWMLLGSRAPGPGGVSVAVLHSQFSAFGAGHVPTTQRMRLTAEFLVRQTPAGTRLALLPESSFVNLAAEPELLSTLHELADARDLTLVVGVAQALKFDRSDVPVGAEDRKVRDGAWLFERGQTTPQRYDKVHRLPFAEYLPLRWIGWPAWLVSPPLEVIDTRFARVYPTRLGFPVGIMVCWDSMFAGHAGSLARQGAGVLLQMSNEGWFSGTAAGRKHNATVRLRAVETQRSVLAAVNAGPSIIVDRFGRVLAQSASPQSPSAAPLGWVTATVAPSARLSIYTRIGDLFVALCAITVLVLIFSTHRSNAS